MDRLAQFSLDHPLILRTRSRLARAIIHRIHLGASASMRTNHSKDLLDAVLDPQVKILIGGTTSGSIHAWSMDGATQELASVLPSGESLTYSQPRDDTAAVTGSFLGSMLHVASQMRVCDGRSLSWRTLSPLQTKSAVLATIYGREKDLESLDESTSVEIDDQMKTAEEQMALPTEKASELLDRFLKLHQAEAPRTPKAI